jgi:hypothetical protein
MKSEREVELKVLSWAIVNQQDLIKIQQNSKYLTVDEKRRVDKILVFCKNRLDYSFLFTRSEKSSILTSVKQYSHHFPTNFANLTLLEKATILLTRFPISFHEHTTNVPEILFFEELTFTNKICELETKCLFSELSTSVKRILSRVDEIKKTKETSHLRCRDIFSETFGNSSGMDQIVRKRIIPLFERLFTHRLKKTTSLFSIVCTLCDDPKVIDFCTYLNQNLKVEQIWCQTAENLDQVRFRTVMCFMLNQRCLTDSLDAIFRSIHLRHTFEKTSFFRRKDTQAVWLKIAGVSDKLPFQLNLSTERNEYNSTNW